MVHDDSTLLAFFDSILTVPDRHVVVPSTWYRDNADPLVRCSQSASNSCHALHSINSVVSFAPRSLLTDASISNVVCYFPVVQRMSFGLCVRVRVLEALCVHTRVHCYANAAKIGARGHA